ncbi:MAG TPA: phospholipase D-like domain-containing protein, partial [Xanthomonadaceae bacterium]|nr:phospholipase D-like domain-containing protein [Xanthomonadaceae bacterium]
FNPFSSPHPSAFSRFAQFVLKFRQLNRRMHDKSFIVDNDVAVIGGRNIGDPYFDASSDNNFRDLDLLAIGPVVPAATRSFEAYWNSDAARPLSDYESRPDPAKPDPAKPASAKADPAIGLASLRASLEKDARTFDQTAYKQNAMDDLPNGASADHPGTWFWGHATLVADAPEKIEAGSERKDLRISPELQATIKGAQSEVLLISPYFVPSKPEEQNFIALAQHGVAFKILTNSLASTDEVPVHAGYASHRRALLEGGVQLFELKPAAGAEMAATDVGRSSGASLHAKAFVVDERYVFIGSLNMDQRSKLLNTEMGVVVDSPQLAKAVSAFFATATAPANAYHVVLGASDGSDASEMHWETSVNGKDVDYHSEPDATFHRHAEALLMRALPIEGLL